ncbi:hypothetical protein BDF20DRAFT_843260 [Mycotypha africana]|uniref:uncharacterized protein n=1 Tax=Mycotypha africana TaxID=64632 RepID=UPI00230121B8|nr:uncharacterized protein BDF20DRAFT_843260 [Mycotypha africana]KAI8991201.1 hypothetical protein BDF20DRAFT_843260 [Mycotypha africana]
MSRSNHSFSSGNRKASQHKQKQSGKTSITVEADSFSDVESVDDSFIDDDNDNDRYYELQTTETDNYYHPTDTKRSSTIISKASRKNSFVSTSSVTTAERIVEQKKPLGRPPKSQHQQRRSSSLKGNGTTEKPKKRGRPTNKAKAAAQAAMSHMAAKSNNVDGPQRKDVKAILLKLLDNIQKRDAYGFFLEPVDPKYVPDYLKIIKHPMDFSTMRKKIENGEYGDSVDGFRLDFKLIITNAKTYNAVDTIYWKSADKIYDVGLRLIDRADKQIEEDRLHAELIAAQQEAEAQQPFTSSSPVSTPSNFSTLDDTSFMLGGIAASDNRKLSISFSGRKDSLNNRDEDVDIMSIDSTIPTLRKQSRQGSEIRESSVDLSNSRAMTPIQSLSGGIGGASIPYKKKKKKAADAGVIYGPDGSVHTVGGVPDPATLVPLENPFHDLPEMTYPNPAALPSAFFLNKHSADEFHLNKHFVRPAQFSDYGPFTTLGTQPPGAFYTALDASYIYPIFGDDRGEAYLKSLWDFLSSEEDDEEEVKHDKNEASNAQTVNNLKEIIEEKSNYLTRGAWKVVQQTLERKNDYVEQNKKLSDKENQSFDAIKTEFGLVEAANIVDKIQAKIVAPAINNAAESATAIVPPHVPTALPVGSAEAATTAVTADTVNSI